MERLPASLRRPAVAPIAPQHRRLRTVLVVIAACIAAPFVLVAFLASFDRTR